MPAPRAVAVQSAKALEHSDVLRFFSLATCSYLEFDRLAFLEILESITLDVGEVHEYIVSILT